MLKYIFSIVIVIFCVLNSQAQKIQETDSTFLQLKPGSKPIENFESQDTTHSPRLAALYSAVVPGMGQFYNEKYWKIPVVYALGFFAASQIKKNHQNYMLFRNVYFNLIDGDDTNNDEIADYANILDEKRAERRVEVFKRDRDYWIILTGLFYVLNIVDATVDAHLREFNINQNLSMKVSPQLQGNRFTNMHAGLSLNFRIK